MEFLVSSTNVYMSDSSFDKCSPIMQPVPFLLQGRAVRHYEQYLRCGNSISSMHISPMTTMIKNYWPWL